MLTGEKMPFDLKNCLPFVYLLCRFDKKYPKNLLRIIADFKLHCSKTFLDAASCRNILANLLSVNLINSFHLKLIELSNLFCTFRVRIINVIIINL